MTEQRDPDLQTDGVTTEVINESWKSRIVDVWNGTKARVTQFTPLEQVSKTVFQWFNVSETEIAEILEKVRSELPTTEAILIGKPQTGKSSIIRGLTGFRRKSSDRGFVLTHNIRNATLIHRVSYLY